MTGLTPAAQVHASLKSTAGRLMAPPPGQATGIAMVTATTCHMTNARGHDVTASVATVAPPVVCQPRGTEAGGTMAGRSASVTPGTGQHRSCTPTLMCTPCLIMYPPPTSLRLLLCITDFLLYNVGTIIYGAIRRLGSLYNC